MNGRQRRLWLARALGLALILQLLIVSAPAQALSWRLPIRGTTAVPARPAAGQPLQRLQEVPPPDWVQRMEGALEARDPRVRILAPADGTLLPDGPWTLRLQVNDWPLVDAGPLGLGPHLVVQLDGHAPLPVVATEVEMPPLSPGSHLLTVYAAKPWGEAHKSPMALQQIRLHRLAPNTATLPAAGTPQLLAVSPMGPSGAPPLLLDWLLLDAPLQGLRTDALGWRLRVTLNGESVLLDRQTPLWLKGWRSGSNALLLELLDGRGEPLNPPFNSLLREVIVTALSGSALPPSRPPTTLEMAVLLGDQPLSALVSASPPPPPLPEEEGARPGVPFPVEEPAGPMVDALQPSPNPTDNPDGFPLPREEAAPGIHLAEQGGLDKPKDAGPLPPFNAAEMPPAREPEAGPAVMPLPGEQEPPAPQPVPEPAPVAEPEIFLSPPTPKAFPVPGAASPSQQDLSSTASDPPAVSSQTVPAREEVNSDGTLKRPVRNTPLERLWERLQR